MAKLKLNPDPTFKTKVGIPVPGGTSDVEVEYKYRDRKELAKWFDEANDAEEVDLMLGLMVGWDLDDEFSRENVERLCTSYPGASREITRKYVQELSGIRQGN